MQRALRGSTALSCLIVQRPGRTPAQRVKVATFCHQLLSASRRHAIFERDGPQIDGAGAITGKQNPFSVRRPSHQLVVAVIFHDPNEATSIQRENEDIFLFFGVALRPVINQVFAVWREAHAADATPIQGMQWLKRTTGD